VRGHQDGNLAAHKVRDCKRARTWCVSVMSNMSLSYVACFFTCSASERRGTRRIEGKEG
jgi:hypothetical protein